VGSGRPMMRYGLKPSGDLLCQQLEEKSRVASHMVDMRVS
jgi:hypothetical protein